MSRFYVINARKWKQTMIIVVFAFFTAIFLWIETGGVFSIFNQSEETVLSKGNSNESNIALTFNISWGNEKVHDILAQLDEHDVRATFFISGEWAERHPDILKMIVDNEHEIGMLGYRYKSYLDQEADQVRKDILYAKEIFRKLGYEDINLLRPPSGHFNEEIVELANQLGLEVIYWNNNPHDWQNPGTQQIVDHVMNDTANGDIILLHASDSAKQTANALKTILPGLKNKGFNLVSISELLNQAQAEAKLIE